MNCDSLRSCLGVWLGVLLGCSISVLADLMGVRWPVLSLAGVILAYSYIADKRDNRTARQEKEGA